MSSTTPGVGKVRPAGKIRPMSSVDPARGGSSVLTLNPARVLPPNPARVLPPNAPKDEQCFHAEGVYSHTYSRR